MKLKTVFRGALIALTVASVLIGFMGCENPATTLDTGPLSITVVASGDAVGMGESLQFHANIAGNGDFSRAVTWSVSGKTNDSTKIDSNGLLTAAEDEEALTLTVTAVLTTNDVKIQGSKQVAVKLPSTAKIWYVSVSGAEGAAGTLESPLNTVSEALAKIQEAYADPLADPLWVGKGTESEEKAYILIDGEIAEPTVAGNGVIVISGETAGEYPPIELRGRDASHSGKINARSEKRVLYVKFNKVTLGPNLTLTGGNVSGADFNSAKSLGGGAGVWVDQGGNVTLAGALITANSATGMNNYLGGGVYINSAVAGNPAGFTITSGKISNNQAKTLTEGKYAAGGGVYVGDNAVFTMTGGIIEGNTVSPAANTAAANSFGGNGVYIAGASSKFKLGGNAQIALDNEVRLVKGTSIILTEIFSGQAKIDLASSGNPDSDWLTKPVLEWDDGISGDFPAGSFTLGNFRKESNNAEDRVNSPILYGISAADGCLRPIVFTVTEVRVTPANPTVSKGGGIRFYAAVDGSGPPPQGVTWSIEGAVHSGTNISGDGYLTVAEGETAASLTVKAVSAADTDKSGTTTVSVLTSTEASRTWYVSATGSDSNDGRSGSSPAATFTKVMELVKTAYEGGWPQSSGIDDPAIIVVSGNIPSVAPMATSTTVYIDNYPTVVYPPMEFRGDSSNPGTINAPTGTNKRVMFVRKNSVTLGANLTLTGGAGNIEGIGVCVRDNSIVIIDGAVISGNASTHSSGGGGVLVYCSNDSNAAKLILRSGKIINNTTSTRMGGGVSVSVGSCTGDNRYGFVMEGGEISGNSAPSTSTNTGWGGGVYVQNGIFKMSGGTIKNNSASKLGGGVYAHTVEISGGVIESNEAVTGGGGLYLTALATDAASSISNTAIKSNKAASGGGLYLENYASVTMSGNSVIELNEATTQGGGIYVRQNANFTLESGTIQSNQAKGTTSYGGGGGGACVLGSFANSGGEVKNNTSASHIGNGVLISGKLKLSGNGKIDLSNDVLLNYTTSAIVISGSLNGSGNVAAINIASGSDADPAYIWACVGKEYLKWDEGLSGALPTSRFTLGNIHNYSLSLNYSMNGAMQINSATGCLEGSGLSQVTGVSMDINAVEIAVGGVKQNFIATVSATGYPNMEVNWTLSGNTSANTVLTTVTNSAYNAFTTALSVGADETAQTLTVTATSVNNSNKSASATVTVTDGKLHGNSYTYNWHNVKPTGFTSTNDALFDIAYGNGVFMVSARLGKIFKSTDNCATWTLIPAATTLFSGTTYGSITSLAYGNYNSTPTFVAVGGYTNYTTAVYSTDDGATWTKCAGIPATYAPGKVVFGNNTFVALKAGTTLYRSTDGGANWNSVTLGFSGTTTLIFAHGKFLMLGNDGTNIKIFSSTDGETWTAGTSSPSAPSGGSLLIDSTVTGIVAGPSNRILVLGRSASTVPINRNMVVYSDDFGSTWNVLSGWDIKAGNGFKTGAIYGDGVYLLGTTAADGLYYSADGSGTNAKGVTPAIIYSGTAPIPATCFIYVNGNFYGVASSITGNHASGLGVVYTSHQ